VDELVLALLDLFLGRVRLFCRRLGMLREVGKRDEPRLIAFLERHAHEMPRVMLRYAVERLDARVRTELLDGARSQR
jgi:DNA alkylation repair enzyme